MANIHMFLQGKGGVGKSFAATLLAQKMIEDGKKPLCIDVDPHNPTFSGYKALNVQRFKVMEGDDVDPWKFDQMIELIEKSKEDVIIDNGASSFIALASYIKKTEIPALLNSIGHTLVIHTVIVGANALADTVEEFVKTVSIFPPETKYVVWINPVHGAVQVDGKEFTEFKAYKNNAHRIAALVEIPAYDEKTFGRSLRQMMTDNLTFQEALKGTSVPIVSRQRLTIMRRDIYKNLEPVAALA